MKKIITASEWNDLVDSYDSDRIFLEGYGDGIRNVNKVENYTRLYLKKGKSWATIRMLKGNRTEEYVCALVENPDLSDLFTLEAAQWCGRNIKKKVHLIGDEQFNKSFPDGPNFSYYNKEYDKKVLKIWSYDINSAYPWALMQDWPDTQQPLGDGILEKGQIGFKRTWISEGYQYVERMIAIFEEGAECEYRFPSMECPCKKEIMKAYKMKKAAKDKLEKSKWKKYLVVLAGMLRNWNTFVRTTMLTRSMQFVQSFFDDDTVYANVDSIYSMRPRDDLPIGTEIGQFKKELDGEGFIYKGAVHGTNNDPRWSGVPREWIQKHGDFIGLVLNDETPPEANIYDIDWRTGRLYEKSTLDDE